MTTSPTQQHIEIMAKMFREGRAFTEIGRALGFSRRVVAARLARIGLKRDDVKARLAKPTRPTRQNQPAIRNPIRFLELLPDHCRAILDDRDDRGGPLCCGEPQAEGSSWCAYHRGLYTQPETSYGQAGQRQQPVR